MQFPLINQNEIDVAILSLIQSGVNDNNYVASIGNLRKKFDFDTTSFIIDQVLLRPKASKKFPQADKMFFTKDALEQSSSQLLSEFRAERFIKLKGVVYDLGCGLGIDGINIAKHCKVVGVDKDEKRLSLAELNSSVYGVKDDIKFQLEDFTNEKFLIALRKVKNLAGLFMDPSRRDSQGKRKNDYEDYEPTLEFINELLPICPNICVKVGPGIDYIDLVNFFDAEFDIEIVELDGECKEAILWFGELRGDNEVATSVSAVLLPEKDTVTDLIENSQEDEIRAENNELAKYLYEPVGALSRAHLVYKIAEQFALKNLSQDIIYLTGDDLVVSPFLKNYEVESIFHYGIKEINEYVRENKVTEVTLKKRGVEINLDEVYVKLDIEKNQAEIRSQIFIITKVQNDTKVIAVKRINSHETEN